MPNTDTGLKTKAAAEMLGQRLLEKMDGEGWTVRVWENLGWHYQVVNGPLTVHPCVLRDTDGKVKYSVLLDTGDPYPGASFCGFPPFGHAGYSPHPNKLVVDTLKLAQRYISGLQAGLDSTLRRLGPHTLATVRRQIKDKRGCTRPLGKNQLFCLRKLVRTGRWFQGCGWCLEGGPYECRAVLTSLVSRGLARIGEYEFPDEPGTKYIRGTKYIGAFLPTPEGAVYIQRLKR